MQICAFKRHICFHNFVFKTEIVSSKFTFGKKLKMITSSLKNLLPPGILDSESEDLCLQLERTGPLLTVCSQVIVITSTTASPHSSEVGNIISLCFYIVEHNGFSSLKNNICLTCLMFWEEI